MTTWRYVGNPDFHDGFIRAVSRRDDKLFVTVEGSSGKHYSIIFDGVTSVESNSPEDMMLYALSEREESNQQFVRYFDFINWHVDKPDEEKSRPYCRITAKGFTVSESD